MAATLTGTPTAIIWGFAANPAGQSITIPADATAVYVFWAYWASGNGHGLASITLGGNAPSQSFEIPTASSARTAVGVAVWYSPATGSQTLDLAWDATPGGGGGPTTIVAYVKDGDLTAWRDVDADHNDIAAAVSVTLTSTSADLVLKYDERWSSTLVLPSTSSGWTSRQTTGHGQNASRLSSADTPGASSTVCDSEDESYSSLVAVAIPAAAVVSTQPPRSLFMYRKRRH